MQIKGLSKKEREGKDIGKIPCWENGEKRLPSLVTQNYLVFNSETLPRGLRQETT